MSGRFAISMGRSKRAKGLAVYVASAKRGGQNVERFDRLLNKGAD